jgi:hypothetical protein
MTRRREFVLMAGLPVGDVRVPFTRVSVSIDSRQSAREFSTAECW